MILAGDSAGAHLSLLAALTGAKDASTRVQGVILISGAIDVTNKYGSDISRKALWVETTCGNNKSVSEECAPLTHLVPGIQMPPMLTFHGTDDIMLPVIEARKVGGRGNELGGSHTLVEVPRAQHLLSLQQSKDVVSGRSCSGMGHESLHRLQETIVLDSLLV